MNCSKLTARIADLCGPSLDLVDDEDSLGVGGDPALQVGAADGQLAGQLLLGNILQEGPGETTGVNTRGGFLEIENLHQRNRGEHEYHCQQYQLHIAI